MLKLSQLNDDLLLRELAAFAFGLFDGTGSLLPKLDLEETL
jgi:hypothetical protein